MRVGIIGSGHIGATVARRLVDSGHEVAISNSRGPDTLHDLATAIGAKPATVEDAAEFGDLVVEAIPFGAYDSLPKDALQGKVVVDAANYYPGRDGTYEDVENDTASAELIARHLEGAKVVKAFNTMNWKSIRDLHKPKGDPERIALPIAADDEQAKKTVADLIDELGFDPVDGGTLHDSKRQEPGTPVYGADLQADAARDALASAA
jgi:8-hydroxy-5-deazaflavin:NADPH oxidoreductase